MSQFYKGWWTGVITVIIVNTITEIIKFIGAN